MLPPVPVDTMPLEPMDCPVLRELPLLVLLPVLTLVDCVVLSLVPTEVLSVAEIDWVRPTLLPVVMPEEWDFDSEALLVADSPMVLLTDWETPSVRPDPKLTLSLLPTEWEAPRLSEYPFVRLSVRLLETLFDTLLERLLETELDTLSDWLALKLSDWLTPLPTEVPCVTLSVVPVELFHPMLPPVDWDWEVPCDQLVPADSLQPWDAFWDTLPPTLWLAFQPLELDSLTDVESLSLQLPPPPALMPNTLIPPLTEVEELSVWVWPVVVLWLPLTLADSLQLVPVETP